MIEILYDDSTLAPEDGRPLYRVEVLHADGFPHVYQVHRLPSETRDGRVTGHRRTSEPKLIPPRDPAFERLYRRLHRHLLLAEPLPDFPHGSQSWERVCLLLIEQYRGALSRLYSRGFEEMSA